jgi:hypothetical protein
LALKVNGTSDAMIILNGIAGILNNLLGVTRN